MNPYVELRQTFQFLDCASRQKDLLTRCRGVPAKIAGRPFESTIRDYILCLMLVATIAKLEDDLGALKGVPGLSRSMLEGKLKVLRDHYKIPARIFMSVDRIRIARNQFIHEGYVKVNPECTLADVPGIVVSFLQACKHPDYP